MNTNCCTIGWFFALGVATAVGTSCRGGSSRTVMMLCPEACTACANALVMGCGGRSLRGREARRCSYLFDLYHGRQYVVDPL